jgi:YD repeat-containing protein
VAAHFGWIRDYKTGGGPQTHSFSYDALDRLLSASANLTVGEGSYSESYSYNANGPLINGPLGAGYTYWDTAHKHAVSAVAGGHSFANGNLTRRTMGGQSYTLTYDAENRLVSVSGAASASFLYDGDGQRVKGSVGGVITYYPNQYYEVAGGVVKKYYYAGDQRLVLKEGVALR